MPEPGKFYIRVKIAYVCSQYSIGLQRPPACMYVGGQVGEQLDVQVSDNFEQRQALAYTALSGERVQQEVPEVPR